MVFLVRVKFHLNSLSITQIPISETHINTQRVRRSSTKGHQDKTNPLIVRGFCFVRSFKIRRIIQNTEDCFFFFYSNIFLNSPRSSWGYLLWRIGMRLLPNDFASSAIGFAFPFFPTSGSVFPSLFITKTKLSKEVSSA